MPELLIFDCDGVLVDSEPIANDVMAQHLSQAGLPTTCEEARRHLVGLSMAAVVEWAEERLGRPLSRDWTSTVETATCAALSRSVEPVPGVVAWIDRVEAAGCRTCVASSGSMEKLQTTLGRTGLWQRFSGRVFNASMVERGKPAPDLFLHAAARMQVDPACAVVLEDSVAGVRAAVSAKMRVIGFAGDPETDAVGLRDAGAEVVGGMAGVDVLLGLNRNKKRPGH